LSAFLTPHFTPPPVQAPAWATRTSAAPQFDLSQQLAPQIFKAQHSWPLPPVNAALVSNVIYAFPTEQPQHYPAQTFSFKAFGTGGYAWVPVKDVAGQLWGQVSTSPGALLVTPNTFNFLTQENGGLILLNLEGQWVVISPSGGNGWTPVED
jgi:hypothetical protein